MAEEQHNFVRAQAFPATQWSLVDRARQGDDDLRRAALSVLLQRYMPALRAYLVMTRQTPPEQADDLLQSFVADKIIERNLLDAAAPERGKFRSFLLATLNHFVISAHRGGSAAKRAPSRGISGLNDAEQDGPVSDAHDPSAQFTYAWAKETIAEALRRMRLECERSDRPDLWAVLEGRVVRPAMEGAEPVPYERLVRDLSLATPLQACNLLTTAKRMFVRNLRAVAAEYTQDETEADSEIRELRAILSRAGGAESQRVPRM